jgi:hypothetical protein
LTAPLGVLVDRLALSDEEALAIFDVDALDAIAGELGHRPELEILDALTAEASELMGAGALARWLRAGPAGGAPIDLLVAGDFAAFEDALAQRVEEVR